MKATVYVPASIGNVGPGFDVLGLAVSGLGDEITVHLGQMEDKVLGVTGLDADLVPLEAGKNAVVIAAKKYLESKNLKYGVQIEIHRQLPIAGGLGSSAAASVGGALGAAFAAQVPFTDEDILKAALAGESYTSGKHLDNIAPCFLGGFCTVLSNTPPKVYSLAQNSSWWIALLTPDCSLPTKTSRNLLPTHLEQNEWVKIMSHSIALVAAFEKADEKLLSLSLQDFYAEPRRAPLIKNFYSVKEAALKSEALTCALSGAGPTIFAICKNEISAKTVLKSMEKELESPPRLSHIGPISTQGAKRL